MLSFSYWLSFSYCCQMLSGPISGYILLKSKINTWYLIFTETAWQHALKKFLKSSQIWRTATFSAQDGLGPDRLCLNVSDTKRDQNLEVSITKFWSSKKVEHKKICPNMTNITWYDRFLMHFNNFFDFYWIDKENKKQFIYSVESNTVCWSGGWSENDNWKFI